MNPLKHVFKMDHQTAIRKSAKGFGIISLITASKAGFGFITQIILARILLPEHFGNFVLAFLILEFFNTISNLATNSYIIQKKETLYNET